ncbi:hypothetical protein [Hydrogenophaga sp.]|uniref:hypothetical protein n=1 Tax=Hydrogenophaga sp. TaxID=1904254 RepID=UPI003F6F968D
MTSFPLTARRAALALPIAFLAACGGDASAPAPVSSPPVVVTPPPPVVLPPVTTTLSVSTSALALAVSGLGRTITVTNTGADAATALALVTTPALPAGSIVSSNTCSALAAGASCLLTITPGATASAAAGDTSPVPVTVRITGSNTNTVTTDVSVLDHGSVYQAGYVFSLDDTTPPTASVGGRVAALNDSSPGVPWAVNAGGAPAFDNIPGISETDVAPPCNGNRDGACNTNVLVSYYATTPVNLYAAGSCKATLNGLSDWYLPAICEMGFDGTGNGTGCGTSGAPLTDSIQSNLVDKGNIGGIADNTYYWSSTQYVHAPSIGAYAQYFSSQGGSAQEGFYKAQQWQTRCVRALTL